MEPDQHEQLRQQLARMFQLATEIQQSRLDSLDYIQIIIEAELANRARMVRRLVSVEGEVRVIRQRLLSLRMGGARNEPDVNDRDHLLNMLRAERRMRRRMGRRLFRLEADLRILREYLLSRIGVNLDEEDSE